MCYATGQHVPAPTQAVGPVTASSLVGVSLDSLTSNGGRLMKLPSATQLPKIKGVSLVDATGQVK